MDDYACYLSLNFLQCDSAIDGVLKSESWPKPNKNQVAIDELTLAENGLDIGQKILVHGV